MASYHWEYTLFSDKPLYERDENMEKMWETIWEIYEDMDKMGGTSMNTWKNTRKNFDKFDETLKTLTNLMKHHPNS